MPGHHLDQFLPVTLCTGSLFAFLEAFWSECPKVGLNEDENLAWVEISSASLEIFFYLHSFIQLILLEFLFYTIRD